MHVVHRGGKDPPARGTSTPEATGLTSEELYGLDLEMEGDEGEYQTLAEVSNRKKQKLGRTLRSWTR